MSTSKNPRICMLCHTREKYAKQLRYVLPFQQLILRLDPDITVVTENDLICSQCRFKASRNTDAPQLPAALPFHKPQTMKTLKSYAKLWTLCMSFANFLFRLTWNKSLEFCAVPLLIRKFLLVMCCRKHLMLKNVPYLRNSVMNWPMKFAVTCACLCDTSRRYKSLLSQSCSEYVKETPPTVSIVSNFSKSKSLFTPQK